MTAPQNPNDTPNSPISSLLPKQRVPVGARNGHPGPVSPLVAETTKPIETTPTPKPAPNVFGGGSEADVLAKQEVEAYLNARTLSFYSGGAKDICEVVRPVRNSGLPNLPWYREHDLAFQFVYKRLAVAITYLNPYGKPYLEGEKPYKVVRLIGKPIPKDGKEIPDKPKPPKVLAPYDRAGQFHFPKLDPAKDGTYAQPPVGMRMCHLESALKAQAVFEATRSHCCGGNGVDSASEKKRGNEFMLHMIDGFDIKAYDAHVLIPDSNAFGDDANAAVQAAHRKRIHHLRVVAECRNVYEVNIGPHPLTKEPWGPDDFLRYYDDVDGEGAGGRRMAELILSAPVAQAEAYPSMVKAMNQLAVYANDNGLIYDLEDGIGRDIGAAHRKYRPYGRRDGDKWVHAPDEWLASHARNVVATTGYEYLGDLMFKRRGVEMFNIYRPSGPNPGEDYEYGPSDKKAHDKFMRGPRGRGQIIFRAMTIGMGDWSNINFCFSWLRYLWLTNKPLKVYLAMFGPEGYGKGYWLKAGEALIGQANARVELNVTAFLKNFNDSWFYSRLAGIGESQPSYEQRVIYSDAVKGFVGDGVGMVEGKFRRSRPEPVPWGLMTAANDINDLPRSSGAGRRDALIDFAMPHFTYDFEQLIALPEPVPKWGKGNPAAAASWDEAFAALEDAEALNDWAAWLRDTGEIDDINMASFRADEMVTREASAYAGKSEAGKVLWSFRAWLLESGLAEQKPVWTSGQLLAALPELKDDLVNRQGKTTSAFKSAAVQHGEWVHSEDAKATEGAAGGLLGASRTNAYFVSEAMAQTLSRAEAVEFMDKPPTSAMLVGANKWKEEMPKPNKF